MIVGLGIDVVALPRVERMWKRWGERIAARVALGTARPRDLAGLRREQA